MMHDGGPDARYSNGEAIALDGTLSVLAENFE
jgi:hypothetical protein